MHFYFGTSSIEDSQKNAVAFVIEFFECKRPVITPTSY